MLLTRLIDSLHRVLRSIGNSSETAQQNFVKLCSYEGHNVLICIVTGYADLIYLRSKLYPSELWPKLFCATQI